MPGRVIGNRPRGHHFPASTAFAALVIVGLLIIETGCLIPRSHEPALLVTVSLSAPQNNSAQAVFRLTAPTGSLVAHVAILPGEARLPTSHVIVFQDAAFPVRFANPSDVVGLTIRLESYLGSFSPSTSISTADATDLPSQLAAYPSAALVVFGYGELPSTVFSLSTTTLVRWIEAGGTLVWAGGPLGYFVGTQLPDGSVGFSEDPGWAGQTQLAGYQLEDPLGNPAIQSDGPLVGSFQSPLAESLGIVSQATIDGANTSRLASNGAFDLGWDSPSGNGSGPRTSLAYVPRGSGGIFYFGGALWGTGSGTVPNADVEVSADISLLIGTGYIPGPGPTPFANVDVGIFQTVNVDLASQEPVGAEVGFVSSQFSGTMLFEWARQLY